MCVCVCVCDITSQALCKLIIEKASNGITSLTCMKSASIFIINSTAESEWQALMLLAKGSELRRKNHAEILVKQLFVYCAKKSWKTRRRYLVSS